MGTARSLSDLNGLKTVKIKVFGNSLKESYKHENFSQKNSKIRIEGFSEKEEIETIKKVRKAIAKGSTKQN